MLSLTTNQKINWVRIIAIASTLVMMLYAPNLWISTKGFPPVPLFNWLPELIYPADYIFGLLFFGLQLLYIFYNKRWLGFLVILLYIFLSFVDQNRLQPYFYQSALTILAIIIFPKNTNQKKVLYAIILIFIATYFWSGIQKVNGVFYVQWLHALEKHFSFLPHWFLNAFTYAVPWLEASMGLLLLANKTRKITVSVIVFMHSVIIVLLLYLGYGYNVIPWNIQNILSVLILFWGLQTSHIFDFFVFGIDKQKLLVLLFTFVLPLSNFFGLYDNLLSFSFFTSKLNYYYVEIGENLQNKLPNKIQQYYRTLDGKTIIYVNEWAGEVNKVLFYPEERTINYINQYLRSFADDSSDKNLTKLVIYNRKN